jgi:hypothetical protein
MLRSAKTSEINFEVFFPAIGMIEIPTNVELQVTLQNTITAAYPKKILRVPHDIWAQLL